MVFPARRLLLTQTTNAAMVFLQQKPFFEKIFCPRRHFPAHWHHTTRQRPLEAVLFTKNSSSRQTSVL
jgi:hypothetical protein